MKHLKTLVCLSLLALPVGAFAADCPGAYDLEDCDVGQAADACFFSGGIYYCYLYNTVEDPGGSIVVISDFDNGGADKISAFGIQPDGEKFCCTFNHGASWADTVQVSGSKGDDFMSFSWVGDVLRESTWGDMYAFLSGAGGADDLYGSTRDHVDYSEVLDGGDGADYLQGNAGADTLLSGSDNSLDTMYGNEGNDTFSCDSRCAAWGGPGDDKIRGSSGVDTLRGGDGDDQICGKEGNDTLRGGDNDDFIWGGAGTDTMIGGLGTDWCASPQGPCEFLASGGCPFAW